MYKQFLTMLIGIVYALTVLIWGCFQEDTYLYNMLNDKDCFVVQQIQYEDGSCRH